MASCGSEEEQSSCCPRGYIASGPSSLALRGYIHWRSQRPASTLPALRAAGGIQKGSAAAPARPRRSPRCAGRAAAVLPGLAAACAHGRLLRARSHAARGCFCARVFTQRQAAIGFSGKPRGTRFSRGGRRVLPAAAGVRETRVRVLPVASHPFFLTEWNKSLHFLPLPSPASPFPAAGRRPRREQEG